jgi:AcrR family transcriptional regulator
MSSAASIGTDRPLRRDAAQNRERLLAAASQVFDAQGLDAGVEEVARVAGVGMGTLYRRFPTKDALIEALVHEVLAEMIRLAREAVSRPEGTGLEYFLESASAHQAEHRGCLPRLWRHTDGDMVQQARDLIAGLLADAKRHHRVREDLTSTDLTMVLWSTRGVIETTQSVAPDAWRRHLDLLLAGMRPSPEDLPHRPVSPAEVDSILTGHGGTLRLRAPRP